ELVHEELEDDDDARVDAATLDVEAVVVRPELLGDRLARREEGDERGALGSKESGVDLSRTPEPDGERTVRLAERQQHLHGQIAAALLLHLGAVTAGERDAREEDDRDDGSPEPRAVRLVERQVDEAGHQDELEEQSPRARRVVVTDLLGALTIAVDQQA